MKLKNIYHILFALFLSAMRTRCTYFRLIRNYQSPFVFVFTNRLYAGSFLRTIINNKFVIFADNCLDRNFNELVVDAYLH